MKFRHLATSNVRGNWRQYAAFFFSSAFSVMIFFLYAQFVLHPDVEGGTLYGANYVKNGMIACQYIIVVFSFFFVLYSLSSFLKSRSKEFGLLSLFGMTGRQIGRMVLTETVLIALVAITAGIALGTLFSKLFLLAVSELMQLDSPIRFMIVWKAVGITYAVFIVLFTALSAFTIVRFSAKTVVEQLREGRKPKTPPPFSSWLSVLAAVTIGSGYFLAYMTKTPGMLLVVFFPVIGLVVFGTYFLFTQASVAAVRWLQRSAAYFRGTNMLVLSQMAYKLKDNARMLFTVTTLSAVVLTASSTLYVFLKDMQVKTVDAFPQTLTWSVEGEGDEALLQKVHGYLRERGVTVENEVLIRGLSAFMDRGGDGQTDVETTIVSESQYNALKESAKERLDVENGQAVLLYPTAMEMYWGKDVTGLKKVGFELRGPANAMEWSVIQAKGEILHATYMPNHAWLVIDDADYEQKLKQFGAERQRTVYGLELSHWKELRGLESELREKLFDPVQVTLLSRIEPYHEMVQVLSLTLFVGIFICVLFFVAAGSVIYFKMFTELQGEQAMYRSLLRIGLSEREMRSVVGRQLMLIFFIPFFVGSVHTAFAMKALGNVLMSNIWGYALTVLAIYFLMQTVYYMLAKRMYFREIVKGTRLG